MGVDHELIPTRDAAVVPSVSVDVPRARIRRAQTGARREFGQGVVAVPAGVQDASRIGQDAPTNDLVAQLTAENERLRAGPANEREWCDARLQTQATFDQACAHSRQWPRIRRTVAGAGAGLGQRDPIHGEGSRGMVSGEVPLPPSWKELNHLRDWLECRECGSYAKLADLRPKTCERLLDQIREVCGIATAIWFSEHLRDASDPGRKRFA